MSSLREVWFHTGTDCNLSCGFCFEKAGPGDTRVEQLTFEDARPFIDEAVQLGVKRFSFTGGEPFLNPEFLHILKYALTSASCQVLTNGTDPFHSTYAALCSLPHRDRLFFRVSIDQPREEAHDAYRGRGSFQKALEAVRLLAEEGFSVSVARHRLTDEDPSSREAAYASLFRRQNISVPVPLVSFPDLAEREHPPITSACMTAHHTPRSRAQFMCAFSRMIVKQKGTAGVYSCTLVDDDPSFNLGTTLTESCKHPTYLEHPRCYTCFAGGVSCSEL
jgi:sulfatase maturation enzyme AslB (radical SAM superfamily)